METCVLIPKQLSLVMTKDADSRQTGNIFDMSVTVLSNELLVPGVTFEADEGHMRLDHLECFTKLDSSDVRYKFGCDEDIVEVDGRQVRHCNWVRFLQSTHRKILANVCASIVQGQAQYKVIRNIYPNDEILVYFKEYNDNDTVGKENVPRGIKRAPSSTPFKKRKFLRRSISIFDYTPVRRPCVEFMSPEKARDIPQFASPITDHNNGSGVLSHTSPSSNGSDGSPNSVTSKNVSPLSSIAPESPDRRGDALSCDEPLSPGSEQSNMCIAMPEHQLSPWGKSRDESMDSTDDNLPETPNAEIMTPLPKMQKLDDEVSTPISFQPYKNIINVPNYQYTNNFDSNVSLPKSEDSLKRSNEVSPPGFVRRREKTWLPCDVCGKKFDRPSLLKRHMRTHTGEKPHACDVCGKAFSTSSSLNTHRRIHSGEKPHECPVCGKCFTASSNLYYHRMTHKKEKPHKCNLCSKSFPTPGDLRSHMYVHNGSWPYKCDICNRGFSKQTNLKNHMLLHSGDKPHECPHCGKKFGLACNLKTHIKTHEEEGTVTSQHPCNRCGEPLDDRNPTGNMCQSCVVGTPGSNGHPDKTSSVQVHPGYFQSPSFASPPSSGEKLPLYRPQAIAAFGMSPMLNDVRNGRGPPIGGHETGSAVDRQTMERQAMFRHYGVSASMHHTNSMQFRNNIPGFLPPPWPLKQ